MRLLHIERSTKQLATLEISFSEFVGSDVPPYAILSHRWRDEEVLYNDMAATDRSIARSKKGYAKLEMACRLALDKGLSYVWSDTCCIDKGSSAELSEAINSMYSYYTNSAWCIAYLDDVNLSEQCSDVSFQAGRILSRAAWFTRGWTLQELIAPRNLTFFAKSWNKIGTKTNLCHQISVASKIDEKVLRDRKLIGTVGVSEKMSWAAARITMRPEDEAYSLMGLFGVNMAILYGEGRSNAFRRLQLEIMRVTTDHTLFAWESETINGEMLAPSVSCFSNGASFRPKDYPQAMVSDLDLMPNYEMTNAGLRIQLPIKGAYWPEGMYIAFLACRHKYHHPTLPVAVFVGRQGGSLSFPRFYRVAHMGGKIYIDKLLMLSGAPKFKFGSQPVWISARSRLPQQPAGIADLPRWPNSSPPLVEAREDDDDDYDEDDMD